MTAPSQWKKFSSSAPPMPGNRYLLPPGKADHLVRKDRADDDQLIVVEDRPG